MITRNVGLLLLVAAIPCPGWAGNLRYDSVPRGTRELTVVESLGTIHEFPSPVKSHYTFDTSGFRYAWFTSPRTQVGVELGLEHPNRKGEDINIIGTIGYRRNFMVRGSTALGYDLRFGFMRFDERPPEQGSKANFHESVGLTLQYATSAHSAIVVGYVFSHTSNANLKMPNIGINASRVSIGYAWYR